jgi:hypothetical protein
MAAEGASTIYHNIHYAQLRRHPAGPCVSVPDGPLWYGLSENHPFRSGPKLGNERTAR